MNLVYRALSRTSALTVVVLWATAPAWPATTRHVWPDSPAPAPPYADWTTAAHVIQDAVDAAEAGDLVLVTNGVYATGGMAMGPVSLTNRVAVTKPLHLASVNGPQATIIQGAEAPGGGNGAVPVRCAYLADGASLSGFTLTDGATITSPPFPADPADIFAEYYANGGGAWCYSTNAILTNCVLTGNSARACGGGAYRGTLNNCVLTGNSADASGGGAYRGTLNNCTLTGNSAEGLGGGAYQGTLNNCTLSGNSAAYYGGGASGGTLNNCTVTGNSAAEAGGGADDSTLNNCLVYFNQAGIRAKNYSGGTLNYCCTTPLPAGGQGNLSLDPQLASASHLSAGSPCRGAGSPAYATGVDLDGEAWATPPAIGCDEYHSGTATGLLRVGIAAAFTHVGVAYPLQLTGLIEGWPSASAWEFGDGETAANQPYTVHAWSAPGDYAVVLRAYNESHPQGVSATVTVRVVAAVHYVAADSPQPLAPYTSWATAARNLQDAVDAATVIGALVLVTNGVYATGGAAVAPDTLTNRVAVTKPVRLASVNGPQATIIQGAKAPGGGNGDGAVRCVYLADGASLSGFTLTNGATRTQATSPSFQWQEWRGGGAWCASINAVLTNCVLTGNSAEDDGGGAYRGTLNNCTLTGNSADHDGGGASDSTLNNCTLTGNSAGNWAASGGGACRGTLVNCTLTGNSAGSRGGGAYDSTLNNCTLTGNSARYYGGGAYDSTLNNCTLTGNSAVYGGGAYDSTLNNCSLTGNSADRHGGGAYRGTLNNCTVTGNSAAEAGGGAADSTLNNCLVYFNQAGIGANYSGGTLNYCCTTPLPAGGQGNLSLDPQLASASHLSAGSPCRGAGSPAYATGVDLDGEAWATPPAIGCDEYHAGTATGPLSVGIAAADTHVAVGHPARLTGLIEGWPATSAWEFGDGETAANQPYTAHAWSAPGDYAVVLRAYNQSHPQGVSATATIRVVVAAVHYVAADSPQPLAPYTSWATAARNLQDAVDAATVVGALVLVTNGTYVQGVRVPKPLTLRSVHGPGATVITGPPGRADYGCVYLASGASLSGFTVTNGSTPSYGGGVRAQSETAVITNCVLTGNSAGWSGGGASGGTLINCTLTGNSARNNGGGAYGGTLNNCALTGNLADGDGGGAYGATLNNCTLTGNSAESMGGGAWGSTLNNCLVYFNQAETGTNYSGGTLNYCCTTPLPAGGQGNLSLDPQLASASRLSAGSPCRGAGSLAYATGVDLDGEAWATLPAIGCDEYHAGTATGPLSVSIVATFTNVVVAYPVRLTGLIEGWPEVSAWEFGDGGTATNQPYAVHAWSAPGDYAVVLRAYNASHPEGVSASVTVRVESAAVHYVAAESPQPRAPYTSWATAATNIQHAVDMAAVTGGALVLVTNGTYAVGRVRVNQPLALRSVNGPGVTVIRGGVDLAARASLSGFTVTDGYNEPYGGGVCAQSVTAVITDCVLTGNGAISGGGGAYGGTLNNCTLTDNGIGGYEGAGAYGSTLNNCILSGNRNGRLVREEANYALCTLNYCCTWPLPTNGVGNITLGVLFVDFANGNLRLRPDSPCINAGNNAYASGTTDWDGLPRIVNGTVDMGAYEYQGPGSLISYAWLQDHGLPTDGSADFADPDADGLNTWQEWRCQTDPTNALSVLRLLSATPTETGVTVSWQGVKGVTYFLERSVDLGASPPFSPLATNLSGRTGTRTFTDTNAAASPTGFYRVGVGP